MSGVSVGNGAKSALVGPKSDSDCIGLREAFDVLNLARGSMLSMASLYITGVGILLAVWATLNDADLRRGLMVISLPFMAANFVAFYFNIRFQEKCYVYLDRAVDCNDESRVVVDILKPFSLKIFSTIYWLISFSIVVFGILMAKNGLSGLLPNDFLAQNSIRSAG